MELSNSSAKQAFSGRSPIQLPQLAAGQSHRLTSDGVAAITLHITSEAKLLITGLLFEGIVVTVVWLTIEMPEQATQLIPYILIAAGAGLVGGIVAFFWAPGVSARSALQHLTAGVVLAAVASDLIPEVERTGTTAGILGGFAAGGLFMMVLKWFVVRFEKYEKKRHKLPIGLAAAAAVDTIIDGAIISAGFATTQQHLGPLLAAALGTELFFLTLSVGSEFHKAKSKRWHGLATTTAIAALLLVGAALAFFLLKDASETTVAICLAFGAAALIYLIAEELLVEAIEAEKNILSTAMLFLGFLVVLALKQAGG